MRVVQGGNRGSVYGGRFTGHVELEMLDEATGPDRPDTALGHFADGATTNWHAHPGGQLLFVIAGRARVATEADGEVDLGVGTLVVAPAGERHWHGAAAGSDATVLSVTWGTTVWEDRASGTPR
jgi:quercetin dioxygenase-like cupin family protein